ncbi:MAG: SRPBCC family protein [Chitinophagaceae bacterium]
MRLIKLGLISVVVFFLLVLGISLLIPSHVRISRAINIPAPKAQVQNQITHFQDWKQWNVMVNNKGLTNSRFGDSAFVSDQLTVQLNGVWSDSVHLNWHQGKNVFPGGFNFYESGDTTAVQWYFDFYLEWYPWKKFGSLVFDKQLGPSMEQSLTNLQNILGKKE